MTIPASPSSFSGVVSSANRRLREVARTGSIRASGVPVLVRLYGFGPWTPPGGDGAAVDDTTCTGTGAAATATGGGVGSSSAAAAGSPIGSRLWVVVAIRPLTKRCGWRPGARGHALVRLCFNVTYIRTLLLRFSLRLSPLHRSSIIRGVNSFAQKWKDWSKIPYPYGIQYTPIYSRYIPLHF